MVLEKINACLANRGFERVSVNINGISLHNIRKQQDAYIVSVFSCPNGTEFTREQYVNINKQIHSFFTKQIEGNLYVLSIIITNNVNIIKEQVVGEKGYWIIDINDQKLIIYENQYGDFLNLKYEIETILMNERQNTIDSEQGFPYYQPQSDKYAKTKYFTFFNTSIIIINVLVFLFIEYKNSTQNSRHLMNSGALYWPAVKFYHEYYRLFAYMFLHSGIKHLFNNMVVLLFIGDNLERAAGKWKYLLIYFGSGLIAGAASLGYNMYKDINTISVGASGAIFGVVGAMAYIVAINKGRLENISSRQLFLFVIFSLYGGLTSKGIDNAAHIGGLIAGILLAVLVYKKPKKKLFEGGRQ